MFTNTEHLWPKTWLLCTEYSAITSGWFNEKYYCYVPIIQQYCLNVWLIRQKTWLLCTDYSTITSGWFDEHHHTAHQSISKPFNYVMPFWALTSYYGLHHRTNTLPTQLSKKVLKEDYEKHESRRWTVSFLRSTNTGADLNIDGDSEESGKLKILNAMFRINKNFSWIPKLFIWHHEPGVKFIFVPNACD